MTDKPTHFSARIPFAGFYGSCHSERIDFVEERMFEGDDGQLISDHLYESFWTGVDYGHVFERYARQWVAALATETGIGMDFEEMTSPREYNFQTDRIFALISRTDLAKMLRAVRGERLAATIRDCCTSRSGFCSFYPNDIRRWPRVADWDYNHVGIVLQCYLDLLYERRQIKLKEVDLAAEHIGDEEVEDWLCQATDGPSWHSCLAWAALELSGLIRRQREEKAFRARSTPTPVPA